MDLKGQCILTKLVLENSPNHDSSDLRLYIEARVGEYINLRIDDDETDKMEVSGTVLSFFNEEDQKRIVEFRRRYIYDSLESDE